MLERFFKRFKQDNGVTADAETSPLVNIEGMEGKISVPAPTKDDRKWAKKLRNATTANIGSALGSAIASNQNWRVWYLLNRPQFKSGGIVTTEKSHGFGGKVEVEDGIAKAAEHNNVTAAYLLLKYAEKNQDAGAGKKAREEVQHVTVTGLESAANKSGNDVFTLLARTLVALTDKDMHAAGPAELLDYKSVLKKSAIRAGAAGNEAHLDSMINSGLLSGRDMVDAYMQSFDFAKNFSEPVELTPKERNTFLNWMFRSGIVDQVFAAEAQAVDVRLNDARETIEAAREQGWSRSFRDLTLSDGSTAKAGGNQVEFSTIDAKGRLTHVFNFEANRAHRLRPDSAREIPMEKADAAIVDAGRAFADALKEKAPELVWKKGEPFRLRFKTPEA